MALLAKFGTPPDWTYSIVDGRIRTPPPHPQSRYLGSLSPINALAKAHAAKRPDADAAETSSAEGIVPGCGSGMLAESRVAESGSAGAVAQDSLSSGAESVEC
jgi:hypothetical protein